MAMSLKVRTSQENFVSVKQPGPKMAKPGKVMLLPSDPKNIYSRVNLLMHEKEDRMNSKLFKEKNDAIADKHVEYQCKTMKQHNFLISVS